VLGNYTATIDGDEAEASVRVRLQGIGAKDESRRPQKILGRFRARLVRTRKGWRFRYFGAPRYAKLDSLVSSMESSGREMMVPAGAA
jgi:SnoaL-like protein